MSEAERDCAERSDRPGLPPEVLTSDGDQWDPGAVRSVLSLIDGRWILPVLRALERGPMRRHVLHSELHPISDKVLTETLRRMETDRLIRRTAIASVPVEVDYELESRAREVRALLTFMTAWATQTEDGPEAPPAPRDVT